MASLEDGDKNAILPQGQKMAVPEGRYRVDAQTDWLDPAASPPVAAAPAPH